jgi:methionyl-tRNA formyltransferase
MKTMSKRILFFGNERLATGVVTTTPVLKSLLAAGYEVAAVIIAQDETGRSRQHRELEVAEVARNHNIPLLPFRKLPDHLAELADYQASAAVLVAYGKLVPAAVIDLFPRGIINVHPSLLPRHRGPTPLESVILEGDETTGVSLMELGVKMDTGRIFAQQTVPLSGHETKQALADQLSAIGSDMVMQYLPAILEGSLEPMAQDEAAATYDQLIKKQDGVIGPLDWARPAVELERRVRAYAGWPRVRTTVGTTEVTLTAAHVETGQGTPGTLWLNGHQIGMHTSDGILSFNTLIPAGKKEMSAQAFLAGYRPN